MTTPEVLGTLDPDAAEREQDDAAAQAIVGAAAAELARLRTAAEDARAAAVAAGEPWPSYVPCVLGELLGSTPRPDPVAFESWTGPPHARPGLLHRTWQATEDVSGEVLDDDAEVDDQPTDGVPEPLVAMRPLELAELVALCGPAKGLLGVTAPCPAGQLGRGWRWRAYYSLGSRWRGKLGDRPAGWVRTEVVSVRLRRDPGPGDDPRGVVALWRRPLVHMGKAKPPKGGGRPPVATASWTADGGWSWLPGVFGSIPTEVGMTEVKALLREDA